MGRFKQLLIRKGRGRRDKGGTVKRNNSAALGQVPGSPSKDTHNNIFELFCRYWNPRRVGEVDCVLPTSRETPDGLEPEGWWCRLPLTSPPANQKNVHELITPPLSHYYETSHYPLQGGTRSSEGISLLWPPLPGKAIKLFFSTLPKTLSRRFNLVSGYRGRIRLQLVMSELEQDFCIHARDPGLQCEKHSSFPLAQILSQGPKVFQTQTFIFLWNLFSPTERSLPSSLHGFSPYFNLPNYFSVWYKLRLYITCLLTYT